MNKRKLVLFLSLLLLVAALIPAVVQADTPVTLHPSADSYVYEGHPSDNYGTDTILELQLDLVGSNNYNSFLIFDLSSIPSGSNIVSATLTLNDTFIFGAGNDNVYAYRVDESWTETGITWTNKPSVESTYSAFSTYAGSRIWTFDVKNDVQSFVSGSVPNYGWMLAIGSGARNYASRENAFLSARPVLDVTYEPSLPLPEYTFGALLAMVGCFAAYAVIKKTHLNLKNR